jgi:hypothetical protein
LTWIKTQKNLPKKTLREFGIFIGLGIPFFIGWLIPFLNGYGFRFWSLFIGLPLISFGVFSPSQLFYPYKAWMALGKYLAWVNSHIILGLVFIIVLQPIAIFMRLLGHEPLKKINKDFISYRENRESSRIDMKRIF